MVVLNSLLSVTLSQMKRLEVEQAGCRGDGVTG